MATLPNKNPLADLSGGYYAYWTDGTTEGRATLAVILGSTDAQAAAAALGSLTLGTDLAVAHGGTGASTASDARDNLGLTIGTNVQAWDADLDAIASLDPSANKIIYKGGGANWETATLTSFARTLIDDSNAATARATLGVDAAGTDNSTDVTIAAGLDYITISGQELTLGSVDLTTDVTGALPDGNIATAANWNTAYTHSQVTSGNPHSVTKSDVGLGNVENTALSTWAGSANITTLGTIGTGVWQGTAIANAYVAGIDQNLLTTSSPTFAGLTVTGDIDAGTTGKLYFDESLGRFGINRSTSPGAAIDVSPINATTRAFKVVGFTGQSQDLVLVTNDLSTTEYFKIGATGAVTMDQTVTINSDLTLASGSITSASGAISFGNENLSTAGLWTIGGSAINSGEAISAAVAGHNLSGTYDVLARFSSTDAGGYGIRIGQDGTDGVISGIGTSGLQFWTYNGSAWGARYSISFSGNHDFQSGNITTTGTLSAGATTVTGLTVGSSVTSNVLSSFAAANLHSGDPYLELVGDASGSFGAAITLAETVSVGGALIDKWGIVRSSADLSFTYGSNKEPTVNSEVFKLTSSGAYITGDLRIGTTSAVGSESLTVNGDQNLSGDLIVGGTEVTLSNLPTADPVNAGQLWNDSGTVKVSAG